MKGTLYGVGVGPGDPALMTYKAVDVIKKCHVLVIPKSGSSEGVAYNIALAAVVEIKEKELLEVSMPMSRDKDLLAQCRISAARRIEEKLDAGMDAAFLTLGDPSIYSTYAYVHKIVRSDGYEAQMIPGVPSFCAVAAKLSEPLTEAAEPLIVIPASYDGALEYLDTGGTKVLMKTGKSLEQLKQVLKSKNMIANARMVQNCGMDGERVYENILQADPAYFSIIVVK